MWFFPTGGQIRNRHRYGGSKSLHFEYYHYTFCPRGGQTPLPTSMGGHPFMFPMLYLKGPSIYDVHTEGEEVRLRWTPADGGGRVNAMWTSTQKIRAHCRPLTSSCLLLMQRS